MKGFILQHQSLLTVFLKYLRKKIIIENEKMKKIK